MTEFLRMSGIYWGVTAIDVLDQLEKLDRQEIIDFIKKCQSPQTGGISACIKHDPHILYTLSAIQILCIYDCLEEVDVNAVAKYVASLQQPNGSFYGDKWGEVDTRFSFCAVAILTLIVSVAACEHDYGDSPTNIYSDLYFRTKWTRSTLKRRPSLLCLAVIRTVDLDRNQMQRAMLALSTAVSGICQ